MFKFYYLLIFTLFAVTISAQKQEIINTSFENYNVGSINGQENWQIEDGKAAITNDSSLAYTGVKSLNFTAANEKLVVKNTPYSGEQTGISGIVYIDMFVKINSMSVKDFAINGDDLFGGSEKRAFVLEFDTPSGNSGTFRIYDGSSKMNISDYNLNSWNRISARIDYNSSTYQVIFNNQPAVSASFRENYTPNASGNRKANLKEFHQLRYNLGYDGATGSVNASVDDLYVGTNPIEGIEFPKVEIFHTIEIDQPEYGEISLEPNLDEYPDSSMVVAKLTIPEGYKNNGWTGNLSGKELEKSFIITQSMKIGADVIVDENNPPEKFSITVIQPDTGKIILSPEGGTYYKYQKVTASVEIPVEYKFLGWTGDLSSTEKSVTFAVTNNMQIGANIVFDDTPPNIYNVSTADDFKDVCKGTNLKPGDIVELEDGVYNTEAGITIEASGTPSKPIIIRAKNKNKVELTGETYFTFRKCAYVTLEGFYLTSSKYTVIKLEACNNIRITENIFQLTETEGTSGKWLYIGGYWDDGTLLSHHNRIDHNVFRDKHQLGNFITIDGGDSVSQHDKIDHNYFFNIGPRHDNEMEAIRVGWSELSLTNGYTVIEYNLFEECDGDPEIVSIKSCKDTIRYNTFRRSQGTLSLRHGDGSVINNNYFLGEGKAGTGGIRIYARNHKIYNNYFEGLKGSNWDAAITLTNGDTDSGSLSAHWRIDNIIITNNTLVNNYSNFEIGYAKSDNSWKKEPRNVTIANNIVYKGNNTPVKIITSPTNFTWENNIMFPEEGVDLGIDVSEKEIANINPQLELIDSLWMLSSTSPAIDASSTNYIEIKDDIHGQMRIGNYDIGADEYSTEPIINKPLKISDVGPESIDIVSVKDETDLPKGFNLYQNYPNPFNPTTIIYYELNTSGRVELTLYNSLGQRITNMVNKFQPKGKYRYTFNGNNLSSGVYFYTLRMGNNSISKKMVLLR